MAYNKRIHRHVAKILGLGRGRLTAWTQVAGDCAIGVDVVWDRPLGAIKTEQIERLIVYLAGSLPAGSTAVIFQTDYNRENIQDVITIEPMSVRSCKDRPPPSLQTAQK